MPIQLFTAFLVELFPYHVRAKGISVFQWWGRGATFFNQFVNPIGINNAGKLICSASRISVFNAYPTIGWKYYISYCVFLAFEVFFVYFFFPETSNRTLEELAFCTCIWCFISLSVDLLSILRSIRRR